jgi:4-amino-4-deoxy-L-arabinose transferase
LLVFVLSKSRLPFYLLPLFQPLAVLIARRMPQEFPAPAMRWWLLAWFAALLCLRAGAALLERPEDDRALAVQLRALGLERIDEAAFIDTAPRFGLGLYLDAEVERLVLNGEPPLPQAQDLHSELAENEGCRVLLAESGALDPVSAALERERPNGWRDLGTAGSYRVFVARHGQCRLRNEPAR